MEKQKWLGVAPTEQRNKLQSTKSNTPWLLRQRDTSSPQSSTFPSDNSNFGRQPACEPNHIYRAPCLSNFPGKPMKEKQGNQWSSMSLTDTFKVVNTLPQNESADQLWLCTPLQEGRGSAHKDCSCFTVPRVISQSTVPAPGHWSQGQCGPFLTV